MSSMKRGRGASLWLSKLVVWLMLAILATAGPFACVDPPDFGASVIECPDYDRNISHELRPPEKAPAAAAGVIGGNFAVSSSGSATDSVPIIVPPGRMGMEPKLSITYDSSADVGLLGKGFSLAGLSSIYRCARSVAQDGYYRGVELSSDDHLCLDSLRLVEVGTSADSNGFYREYRTFPDTQVKVIGYHVVDEDTALPRRFVAYTKDAVEDAVSGRQRGRVSGYAGDRGDG
jgi:virulence plasmid B protein